jgi:hypothetical protein
MSLKYILKSRALLQYYCTVFWIITVILYCFELLQAVRLKWVFLFFPSDKLDTNIHQAAKKTAKKIPNVF